MHLTQHFALSYLLPWGALAERRDRVIVALAGIAPDVDGVLLLGGKRMFVEYHHLYTHHLAGAALAAGAALWLGKQRGRTAAFAAGAWLLHLLCDLVGAADRVPGEGSAAYPLPLLWPFSDRPFEPFPWGWTLASWQNGAVMAAALALVIFLALRRGRTAVEVFSTRGDAAVVAAIRGRFGQGDSRRDPGAAP